MNNVKSLNAVIIDNHPLICTAIKNILEQEDISVLGEFSDEKLALELISNSQPDIVTVDVDLPYLRGVEIVETLRKNKFDGIIIGVSGKNNLFYGKCIADAGANAFISKKEVMGTIIAAIRAAQNGYTYYPCSINSIVDNITSDLKKLLSLSSQEIKVLSYIVSGLDNINIAEKMRISNKTVSTYKCRIMNKLNCKTLKDLFVFANLNGIG